MWWNRVYRCLAEPDALYPLRLRYTICPFGVSLWEIEEKKRHRKRPSALGGWPLRYLECEKL